MSPKSYNDKMQLDEKNMNDFGQKIGKLLRGGDVIELIGDVGAGKTTLTKGIARGLRVTDPIQSPTFTINRVYEARDNLRLVHYDFYRLQDPGIMAEELSESVDDEYTVTILEWADIVEGVLPADRLSISLSTTGELIRRCELTSHGRRSQEILESIG